MKNCRKKKKNKQFKNKKQQPMTNSRLIQGNPYQPTYNMQSFSYTLIGGK